MRLVFVWRYVRQRRVLTVIFCTSLLYFLIKTGYLAVWWRSRSRTAHQDEIEYFGAQKLRLPKSIEWQSSLENVDNATVPAVYRQKCRYTKQGKRWVVDDLGFLCDRYHLTEYGCCPFSPSSRYLCTTCDIQSTHCCATYEHCVSCCLQPSQRPLLETVIKMTNGSRLRGLLMVKDQYELCLWKCRTSSNSIYQGNKYKDPRWKYCYGLEPKLPQIR